MKSLGLDKASIKEILDKMTSEQRDNLMKMLGQAKPKSKRPRFIPKPRPSKEVEVEDTYICKLCGNRYTSKHTYLTNEAYIVPRIYSLVTCDNCYGFFLEKDRGIAIRALLDYIRKVAK